MRPISDVTEHYRTIFDESPDPMWLVDEDTLRFLDVNRAAVAIYGYTRDEFLQMDLTDPEFHRLTKSHAVRQDREVEALVAEAVAKGELAARAGGALARTLITVTHGSLLRWAIYRRGSAATWLAADIDAVLAPWRRGA